MSSEISRYETRKMLTDLSRIRYNKKIFSRSDILEDDLRSFFLLEDLEVLNFWKDDDDTTVFIRMKGAEYQIRMYEATDSSDDRFYMIYDITCTKG